MAIDVWAIERDPRQLAWLANEFPGACDGKGYRSSAVAATCVMAWAAEDGGLALGLVVGGRRYDCRAPGVSFRELLEQVLADGAARVDGRWVPAAKLHADFAAEHGAQGVSLRFHRCMAGEYVLAVAPQGASAIIGEY